MSGAAHLEIRDLVAVITLDNERRLNAVDLELALSLRDHALALASRADIGAVLLRGAGARAFSAGLDTKYAAETGDRLKAIRSISHTLDEFVAALKALDLPTIAMLQGNCYGAGVHLAVEADFRFGAVGVVCAVPAIRNGLYYPVSALARLRELCGPTRMARILLEGEPVEAATLLRWGFLDELCPPQEIERRTLAFAARLAAQPRQAVRDYRAIFRALDAGDPAAAKGIRATALARAAATH